MPKLTYQQSKSNPAITHGYLGFECVTTFDTFNLEIVEYLNWSHRSKYLATRVEGVTVGFHEWVMNVKTTQDIVIDHINGNPKDNRLANLQLVSQRFNSLKQAQNRPLGVQKLRNSFQSTMSLDDTRINVSAKDGDYLKNFVYTVYVMTNAATHNQFMSAYPSEYRLLERREDFASARHFEVAQHLITEIGKEVNSYLQPTEFSL